MQVFNAYFKIVKKRLPVISIYVVVFLVMTLIFSQVYSAGGGPTDFRLSKVNAAIFIDDEPSPLNDGLQTFLNSNANLIGLEDNAQTIQDALFYGQVNYILRVPQGFSQQFGKSDALKLEKTTATMTAGTVMMDMLVEKYLRQVSFYIQNMPQADWATAVSFALSDLELSSEVELIEFGTTNNTQALVFYFRFMAYSLLAVMIMSVTSVMIAFNQTDIRNRNQCSPIRLSSMNLQLVLGNVIFAVVVWAVLVLATLAISGHWTMDSNTLLLMLNALVFALVALSIGFLVGKFVKGGGVQSAVTNVVSLGISFISGIFVPQELLGDTVRTISSFLPGYWYIKAADNISNLTVYSAQSLSPIIYSMLIQLGFAVAITAVALVVSKQKQAARSVATS